MPSPGHESLSAHSCVQLPTYPATHTGLRLPAGSQEEQMLLAHYAFEYPQFMDTDSKSQNLSKLNTETPTLIYKLLPSEALACE